jgi:hypothetical protein
MGANNGVGVGLGKKPNPSGGPGAGLIAGPTGPGTATLHFTSQDMGALMAVHGQVLQSLVADFPVDPAEQAAATVYTQSAVKNGWTRATFSNARIMSMQVVPGGAVEVTLLHSGASQSPSPCFEAKVANISRSNVKNNFVFGGTQSLAPLSTGEVSRSVVS